jgi:hypothetical protein
MSGYIGTQPVPQATQTRDSFTCTAGQTSFATGGYTPSFLDVFLNGVHLQNGTDYTASNGSDVVLTTGAALDDVLEVVAFTTFEVAGPSGGGLFKGDNGTSGNTSTGAADIFRVNEQTLNTSTTIDADENASATGPLAVASGVTLTVTTGGNLSIV